MNLSAVRVVSPDQALQSLREDLQLSQTPTASDGVALLAAVLRRAGGFMCPSPQAAILSAVKRALVTLPDMASELEEGLHEVFDALLVAGDFVDISSVSTPEGAENRSRIFCGPPSFLVIGERAYLFGVAPDDASFLTATLQAKVRFDGPTRYLEVNPSADVASTLSGLGLRQHTEATWLSRITNDTPQTHLTHLLNRMERDGHPGQIPCVEILQHTAGLPLAYQQRWRAPATESGLYVARAPQEFGPTLWYIASLDQGHIERSMLLPLSGSGGRACDQAWRVQLAIDATSGNPARYSMREEADGYRVRLSFPIPLSARRRLLYLGGLNNVGTGQPGTFFLPRAAQQAAENFLRSSLWLERTDQLYT